MDFIGQGTRLQPGDVGEVARSINIETAVLLAFMDVEANGSGFDTRRRPKVLPEPHRFYAELGAGPARDRAVREGLAYRRWGEKPYPKTFDARFDRIRAGMKISPDAALRACSWGLGQILGSNCVAAGFGSALAMVQSAMVSERNQLQHMANFLLNEGIAPLLRGKDFTKAASWVPVAARYNGPRHAEHNYAGRMATSYIKHKKKDGQIVTNTPDTILARGQRGELVMNLQRDLIAAGYPIQGGADGIFGTQTDIAVRNFQLANNVTIDGRFGPQSAKMLAEILARTSEDNDPAPPVWNGQDEDDPFEDVRAYIKQQRAALDDLEASLPKKE